MKLLIATLVLSGSLFANETFKDNTEYVCLNTHSLERGKKIDANMDESKKNPFVFKINDNKLTTIDKVEFNFMMKKEGMSSYSNTNYMLLLTKNLELGLVPKKARGQIQYYFKCVSK